MPQCSVLEPVLVVKGSTCVDEMHHGATIATLCRKHRLEPLTARDAQARDLTNALNLAEPCQPWDWPTTTPQYVPPNPDARGPFTAAQAHTPLTPPALSLLGVLAAKHGLPADEKPTTFGEAYELLQRAGKGLFGA